MTLPVGRALEWTPAAAPPRSALAGTRVLLEPLDAGRDADALYAASHAPGGDPAIWTYLPDGPYASAAQMRRALQEREGSSDPLFMTIVRRADDRPLGACAFMRIVPEHGVIEIGHIWFAAELQRTAAATEAIHLLATRAFDELGYRRLEWKCDALNARSRRAAARFGFAYEGTFRDHMVVKGRNRDTAWYAMTREDWPAVDAGFRAWLDEGNFDAAGRQRDTLGTLIAAARRGAEVAAAGAIRIVEADAVTPELIAAVAGLVGELSASAAAPGAAELERIVASPASRLLLACDGGRTIGMLTLAVFAIPTGVRAWIEDVVVSEQARGRGVGELLSRAALELAAQLGARTVDLTSRPSREAANRLYARIGFERRETNVYRYAPRRD